MADDRPKQDLPAEIVGDLMGAIRSSFYDGSPRWFKDQAFIRHHVVTWPAAWLNAKGVTLPARRYKEIVMDVLVGIKQHGQTDAVKYWPGYLKHCLQTHFRIHGDEYYQEAKALRRQLETALGTCQRAQNVGADPIQVLALARRLNQPKRPLKKALPRQIKLLFLALLFTNPLSNPTLRLPSSEAYVHPLKYSLSP